MGIVAKGLFLRSSAISFPYGVWKKSLRYVNSSPKIVQKEPYPAVEGEAKLALPYGVDIRENDFVKSRGLIYRAGIPKAVHGNHHIVVTIKREEGIKGAI